MGADAIFAVFCLGALAVVCIAAVIALVIQDAKSNGEIDD